MYNKNDIDNHKKIRYVYIYIYIHMCVYICMYTHAYNYRHVNIYIIYDS